MSGRTGRLSLLVALLAWALLVAVTSAASPPLARLSGVLQPEAATTTATRERVLVESRSESSVSAPNAIVQNAFAIPPVAPVVRHLEQLRRGLAEAAPTGGQFQAMLHAKGQCDLLADDKAKQTCKSAIGIAWSNGSTLAKWMDQQAVASPQTVASTTTRVLPAARSFSYTMDASGRVTRATGFAFSPCPASNPTGAGVVYHDTLRAGPAAGELNNFAAGGLSQGWTQGHIIAAQLGGSNTEPLNFFPQRAFDNNAGRFKQAEDLAALYLARLKGTHVTADCVEVDISFAYTGAAWIPYGGTYSVWVDPLCLQGTWAWHDAVQALPGTLMVFTTHWAQDETAASVGAGQAHARKTSPTVA